MSPLKSFSLAALVLAGSCHGYYDNGGGNVYYQNQQYYYNQGNTYYNTENQYASEGIDYWTNYAIAPQSCITRKHQDVITFQLFEQAQKQCLNKPMGLYYVNVQTYLEGYLLQAQDNAENEGTDYEAPSVSQFLYCTEYTAQDGETYYLKLGCHDHSKEKLAVNVYSDSSCTRRSSISDGTTFDVSSIQVKFGRCQGCVVWFDKDDDTLNANYWKSHQNQAPLCSTVYGAKASCNGTCQMKARVRHAAFWTSHEKFVLFAMFAFLFVNVAIILKVKHSRKLEKLAQTHEPMEDIKEQAKVHPLIKRGLIGTASVFGFIAFICCVARAKKATYILLFFTNCVFFGYLTLLLLKTGHKPCSATDVLDDDDDDDESPVKKGGAYKAPNQPKKAPKAGVIA